MRRLSVQQRYVAVGLLLAALWVLTWALQGWQHGRVSASAATRQAEAVTTAQDEVVTAFEALMHSLHTQAQQVATAPEVVRSLRRRRDTPDTETHEEALVSYLAHQSLSPRMALEIYDAAGTLVSWHGFGMGPATPPEPLDAPQTAVVSDGSRREALTLWHPLRDTDGTRLGAVRALYLATYRPPVVNDYLKTYSLSETWSRETGLAVEVRLGADEATPQTGLALLLTGPDGRLLGRVLLRPPTPEALLEAVRERFGRWLALWMTLLLGWGLFALWHAYRHALPPTPQGGPVQAPPQAALAHFALFGGAWWIARYLLLALEVPGRWQIEKAPLSPLFDPRHLASDFGNGLMRSSGDVVITGLFAIVFALAVLHLAMRFAPPAAAPRHRRRRLLRFAGAGIGAGIGIAGVTLALAALTRHAVLDSTLDYFVRTGLLPERLVLVVFAGLLLATMAGALLAVALARLALVMMWPARPRTRVGWTLGGALVLVPLAGAYLLLSLHQYAPAWVALVFLGVGFAGAGLRMSQGQPTLRILSLRSILLSIFVLALLLYPLLYQGLDAQRRMQMTEAARNFDRDQDPRVRYAIEQLLAAAQNADALAQALATRPPDTTDTPLDAFAMQLLRGSLLATLGPYDPSLTLFDTTGTPVGRFYSVDQRRSSATLATIEQGEFNLLQAMYQESGTPNALVERMTGLRDRFQYQGLGALYGSGGRRVGWVLVRAAQQAPQREGSPPFPHVLDPSRYSTDLYATLSLAGFLDGRLMRSLGRSFGRYRLDEEVTQALGEQPTLWRRETVRDHRYLTYYERRLATGAASAVRAPTVVAVRISAISTFDHLYYLLRLTVSGLALGLLAYLLGLALRYRAGLLPPPQSRFRDKVLNAFFAVGLVTAAATGFAGLQVVTGENERAIQSWLRQHLERVEETLAANARAGELPYRVLDRISLDSLALQTGLDLNLYQGHQLVQASRPQLIRDGLIDPRLPIDAYEALFFEGFRFTHTTEHVGSFTYTAGFRALPDERGQPHYVLSVPTLPEQERIEEERARTVAYLFGALLALVLIVMGTASILAARLTQPIARLRHGLEVVAQGRYAHIPPVRSRDEISELVETFNTMQDQLSESRRRLAQQERQLAWREMARQVAHEIKNPLTPMKLSVQHLRRAYDGFRAGAPTDPGRGRFDGLFDRITTTLIEQIDTLARIANEFSSFARMPQQVLEELDLNTVVREAVSLMQEEAYDAQISLALHHEALILQADREELRRIYINLIKNALQAIPDGTTGQVLVTTRREPGAEDAPGWAYSTVTDSGVGIPEALRGKIFEPNFSTKTSGTGLGLAITRKSVLALSGDIGFETEEGHGTTFWLRLPLVEDDAPVPGSDAYQSSMSPS